MFILVGNSDLLRKNSIKSTLPEQVCFFITIHDLMLIILYSINVFTVQRVTIVEHIHVVQLR